MKNPVQVNENVERGSDRQEHHVAIAEAVDSMDSVIRHVRDLCDHIIGANNDPKQPSPDEPFGGTLQHVLASSAEKIRTKCERIHKMLEDIEAALF